MSDVQPAPAVPGNAGPDDYPRMLFHPDGRTMTVDDATAHDRAAQEGWAQTPDAVHRKATNPTLVIGASDPFAMLVRNVLEQVLDERGLTHQFTQSMGSHGPEEVPRMPPTKGGHRHGS